VNDGATSFEAKLRFLREHCAIRESVETHMSWLLMSDEEVLKLKKPVRTGVLDFSTVHARELDAREELRLNRRLAPPVYLGLLALQWDGRSFALVPEEAAVRPRTVDWLVRMRRLPAERMLDRMIAAGSVTPQHVDALADLLARFYRGAACATVEPAQHLAGLRHEQALNRAAIVDARFGLVEAVAVLDAFDAVFDRHAGLLGGRVRRGRLLDGHGDLRPEHVCLVEPPVVIDALEFNARLRQVDPFDELAFLGLECEIGGAPWIGPRLVERCARALDDHPGDELLRLWRAYRALLRARLALAHLLEPAPRTPQKWLPLARRYVACAAGAVSPEAAA
jgi:aminoglycoside phosphotransferase family enzyme